MQLDSGGDLLSDEGTTRGRWVRDTVTSLQHFLLADQ